MSVIAAEEGLRGPEAEAEAEAEMTTADHKGKGMIPDRGLDQEIEAGKMIGAKAAAGRMSAAAEEEEQLRLIPLGNEQIDKDNFINNHSYF